jgi:hypothetical protein
MALVFGEEKRAKPSPKTKRIATIKEIDDRLFSRIKSPRPMTVRLIPIEATIRGSIPLCANVSETLPPLEFRVY